MFPNQRYWGWRDRIEVIKVGISTLLSVEQFKKLSCTVTKVF